MSGIFELSTQMDLEVVIVNYNTKERLEACLQSVFKSTNKYTFGVSVVDNASTDGSQGLVKNFITEGHKSLKFFELDQNRGFTGGNNVALKETSADFVLLLNPDTVVLENTFEVVLDYMKSNPDVGIAGCKVLKPEGSLDLACRRKFPDPVNSFFRVTGLSLLFPKNRIISGYNLTHLPVNEVTEVDSVMGAFLMINREVMNKIGLLDERFFMYGEDLDWCWRVKEAGYKVMYYPKTSIVHYKGSASKKASTRSLYEFHRAMALFFDKHYKNKYLFLTRRLVYLGIWTRFAILYSINFFRKEKVVSK